METNLFLLAIFGLVVMAALARWMFVILRGKSPEHMTLALFAEAQRELIDNSAQAEFHKAQTKLYADRVKRLQPAVDQIELNRKINISRKHAHHAPPRPPLTGERIDEVVNLTKTATGEQ